jgi:WD40 repeat protein
MRAVMLTLVLGAAAGAADRYGDPLPPGAVARLGTLRFRGVGGCLAFSPDGKLLATNGGPAGEEVTLWDTATGRAVRRIAGSATLTRVAFSPDGKRLACSDNSSRCHVLDAAGGKELFTVAGAYGAFAAGGKVLVTASGYAAATRRLHVWDAATGRPLRRPPVGGDGFLDLAVAPGAPVLAVIERTDSAVARVCDLGTGASIRSVRLGPGGSYWLTLSSDGKALAAADRTGAALWDVASGKQLRRWAQRADGWAAFSPDGRRLAWTGFDERTGIGRLWVAGRGDAAPRSVGNPVNNMEPPSFSPDGKVLAVVTEARVVQLREAATGKQVVRLDAHAGRVFGLAITPDGRHVISRADTSIFAWEVRTGRLLRRLPAGGPYEEYLEALLPDGRLLTADRRPDPLRGLFRVRDLLTGREALRFDGRPDVGPPSATVAPGGRFAALRGRAGEMCVLDLRSGRCPYRVTPRGGAGGMWLSADGDTLVWYSSTPGGAEVHVRRLRAGKERAVRGVPEAGRMGWWLTYVRCASPDGRWLVVPAGDGRLRRWDLTAGKEAPPLAEAQRTVWSLAWSPDGGIVCTRGSAASPGVIDAQARQDTRFWDVATGRRLAHLDLKSAPEALAFSGDGRLLITGGLGGVIRVREVATGQERCRFRGHLAGAVGALAVSADGRLLASGGYDSQVLVWDLTGRAPDGRWRPARLRPEELAAAWQALAGADAAAAHRALWRLAADPEGGTALLRARLRPVAAPEPARLAGLLADLDSERFAVRQRAMRQLEGLGDLAGPALRRAREGRLALEARRRLDLLLEKLEQHPPAGDRLRALRAVEVLERVGTPGARRLLESLAGGAPAAWLTREARAALERLAGRPAVNP